MWHASTKTCGTYFNHIWVHHMYYFMWHVSPFFMWHMSPLFMWHVSSFFMWHINDLTHQTVTSDLEDHPSKRFYFKTIVNPQSTGSSNYYVTPGGQLSERYPHSTFKNSRRVEESKSQSVRDTQLSSTETHNAHLRWHMEFIHGDTWHSSIANTWHSFQEFSTCHFPHSRLHTSPFFSWHAIDREVTIAMSLRGHFLQEILIKS